GASPMTITGACGVPSAKTVCVAVFLSAQPSKDDTAASSSANVLARSANWRAPAISLLADTIGRAMAGAASGGRVIAGVGRAAGLSAAEEARLGRGGGGAKLS